MILKRQNVFVKPKVRSPVIRFKVRHEWWDAGNSTESRGIKTTFDREWSECGRGPGVISLWSETHPDKINQNQHQWPVIGQRLWRLLQRVALYCYVCFDLLWPTWLVAIVSVLTLFICFSALSQRPGPSLGRVFCTKCPTSITQSP